MVAMGHEVGRTPHAGLANVDASADQVRTILPPGVGEYDQVYAFFMQRLAPSEQDRCRIHSIEKQQKLSSTLFIE